MKYVGILTFILFTIISFGCQAPAEQVDSEEVTPDSGRQFFELKTYKFDNDAQVAAADAYFKNAYLPALKRQGVPSVGVFKPRADKDTSRKIHVLIPYNSLNEVQEVSDAVIADAAHQSAGGDFLNAPYDNPMFDRIESYLMRAFIDMPQMRPSPLTGPRTERIYELRSYESKSEALYRTKVDMFNAGGEVKLFDRIQSHAVFYGEVISGPSMPNLVYMTTYDNQESRDAHWKAFVDSPEWKELKVMPKYLNTVSKNTQYFLYPTDYSDY